MSNRLDARSAMVLAGVDEAFTAIFRGEEGLIDVIPLHIPGFIALPNVEAFVPGRLVEALVQVIRLGEGFDWGWTPVRQNPISVALDDLRGIAALFPMSAKSYQAEGLPDLLDNILQGIKTTVEEVDIRRSNLRQLTQAIDDARGLVEDSIGWSDEDYFVEASISLLVLGQRGDLAQLRKYLLESLQEVRGQFDFLVPDDFSTQLPQLDNTVVHFGRMIDLPDLMLCHAKHTSQLELLDLLAGLIQEVEVRLNRLPNRPYARAVRELGELRVVLERRFRDQDAEDAIAQLSDLLSSFRADFERESPANFVVVKHFLDLLDKGIDKLQNWTPPNHQAELQAMAIAIPFHGPLKLMSPVLKPILAAIRSATSSVMEASARREGWRLVKLHGRKTYLPPWQEVSSHEVPIVDALESENSNDLTADEAERYSVLTH